MPILEPTEENIQYCADILKHGGLVGMPTETVYGLAGDATNAESCTKIFATKQRPPTDPLIVHISSLDQMEQICTIQPHQKQIFDVLKQLWPGPMTMVFEKKECIPLICTANQSTVGIRYPSHKVAHRLIELSGPIAAPSANLFGHISPVKAQHVQDDFPELVVLNGD